MNNNINKNKRTYVNNVSVWYFEQKLFVGEAESPKKENKSPTACMSLDWVIDNQYILLMMGALLVLKGNL